MSSAGPTFRKHDDLPGATGLEALGLEWLAEPMADGGAHVVPVTTGPGWIDEPRLAAGSVTASAAEAFARRWAARTSVSDPAGANLQEPRPGDGVSSSPRTVWPPTWRPVSIRGR